MCCILSFNIVLYFKMDPLTEATSPIMARAWLTNHRFPNTVQALGNFSGSDILRFILINVTFYVNM